MTVVSAAIDGTTGFDWPEHLASLHAASVSRRESVNSWYEERLHLILDQFPEAQQHTILASCGKWNFQLADHLSLETLSF